MKQQWLNGILLSLFLLVVGCNNGDGGSGIEPDGSGGSAGSDVVAGSGGSDIEPDGSGGSAGSDVVAGPGGLVDSGGSAPIESGGTTPNGGSGGVGESTGCEGLTTDENGNPLVLLKDAQNYSFHASLTIQTTTVKPMSDLTFDWSEVTYDLRGRDLDPLTGVDMIEVILWENISSEQLLADMTTEKVDLEYLVGLFYKPTENSITSTTVIDLINMSGGTNSPEEKYHYLDPTVYPPESSTYTVMLAVGSVYGQGTLKIHFIRLEPGETNTEVKITDDSTQLDYTVDFLSSERIQLPKGASNITVDWDNTFLTTNALGNEFLATKITNVMIGHYATLTPADLESRFLDIDVVADGLWTAFMDVGTAISLSELKDEAGAAFPGIDNTGTWIIALICGSCTSPAPWFLAVLETCSN